MIMGNLLISTSLLFPVMISADVRRWKMQKERAALGIPANFYPDERMLRVYITLQGIKTIDVSSYDEALSVTMSVADRVHVPKGEQVRSA